MSASASERTQKRVLMLLPAAGFLVSADGRMIAPLLPAIADDYGVTTGAAALVVTGYFAAYSLLQLAFGPLGDRIGKLRVIRVCLFLFALGTGLCALAPTLPALLVLRILTGAAGAAVIPMSLAYIGDSVGLTDRGPLIGRFLSVVVAGQTTGLAVGAILAGLLTWRAVFVVVAVGAFALLPTLTRAASASSRPLSPPDADGLRTVARANVGLLALTAMEGLFFLAGFTFIGPALVEQKGIGYEVVGALLMLYVAGSFVASRRLGAGSSVAAARLLPIGGSIMAATFLVLATSPGLVVQGGCILALGIGFTLAHADLQTRATEMAPDSRGRALALFSCAMNASGAVGVAAAGIAVDIWGYPAVFVIGAAGLAAFAVIGGITLEPITHKVVPEVV